jgi:hypothetical protein
MKGLGEVVIRIEEKRPLITRADIERIVERQTGQPCSSPDQNPADGRVAEGKSD